MSIKDLKFLGVGAPFNYNEDSTSAYFTHGDTIYFIDMGEKIAAKIVSLNILKKVKKVVVFITHFHEDHVGSLAAFLAYLSFGTSIKDITIIHPHPTKLESYLSCLNNSTIFKHETSLKGCIDEISYEGITEEHIDDSYGYLIKDENTSIFYSGDAKCINPIAIELFKKGEIDYFYSDVTLKQNNFHISLDALSNLIDPSLRNRVYLMHFENNETKKQAKKIGFNITKSI